MFHRLLTAGVAAATLAGVPAGTAGAAAHRPASTHHAAPTSGAAVSAARYIHVCAAPVRGAAACDALLRTDVRGGAGGGGKGHGGGGTANPAGYHPADLQAAYKLASAASSDGSGATVAVVDAYDDPYAESDLATYRSTFGLPACTTKNRCFTKVDQSGGTRYPARSGSWSQEISLDLDMVSAICPKCNILLVEAASPTFANLGAAEDTAVRLGAVAVSNSYGGSDAPDSIYGSPYDHTGVAITASAGDGGYGVEYPASSDYVTAVGGTSLTQDSSSARGWSETAWSGTGSGCSAYNSQPSWQASLGTGCSKRAVADVSADADPYTGVSVYDSFRYQGYSGWLEFGGTSVASPIIASVYALAGNTKSADGANLPYGNAKALYDVLSGSNGTCGTVLCTAGTGWDGPTGLGTPDGTGAF